METRCQLKGQYLLDSLGEALEGEALLALLRTLCDSVIVVHRCCVLL